MAIINFKKITAILGLCIIGSMVLKYKQAKQEAVEPTSHIKNDVHSIPCIYMVTPTYRRAEQIPELIRLGQTLLHVQNLLWIVAEDASKPSPEVLEYLARSGLSYLYLRAEMPKRYKMIKPRPKGVSNRNAAIEWIKQNAIEGVVYFGDDDNTYDIRLFEEIRWTKQVSMFPVGLIGGYGLSTPVIKFGKFIGFYDGWIGKRKFPVDMAGFAINVKTILDNPYCLMPFEAGYEEDGFLKTLNIEFTDIELKADDCTKILVWHTRTQSKHIQPFTFDQQLQIAPIQQDGNSSVSLKETNIVTIVKYFINRGIEL